jgi:Zn-dependent protease
MEQTELFPDKPTFDKSDNSLIKTFLSLALFIAAFYFFFDRDINYILVLVFVLLIHELGHFIAMKYFNYTEVKMFFIPLLGALVTGEKKEISQKQRAIILLAGPIPGIIIGLILHFLGAENNATSLKTAANIFIFLNIFNLLPITPLDGGNLIETLFFNSKEKIKTIFIILSSIALVFISLYLKSYVLLVIPLLLLTRLHLQYKIEKIKKTLNNSGIDYNKPFEELTNEEYWKIREEIIANLTTYKDVPAKDYRISNNEKQIADQIKSLALNMDRHDLSGKGKLLIVSIWLLFCIGPFIALGFINKSKLAIIDKKEQLIQECINSTGEAAILSPEGAREYCICAMDNINEHFTEKERTEHEKLSKEQLMDLYSPYMENCKRELQIKIESMESVK